MIERTSDVALKEKYPVRVLVNHYDYFVSREDLMSILDRDEICFAAWITCKPSHAPEPTFVYAFRCVHDRKKFVDILNNLP